MFRWWESCQRVGGGVFVGGGDLVSARARAIQNSPQYRPPCSQHRLLQPTPVCAPFPGYDDCSVSPCMWSLVRSPVVPSENNTNKQRSGARCTMRPSAFVGSKTMRPAAPNTHCQAVQARDASILQAARHVTCKGLGSARSAAKSPRQWSPGPWPAFH